MKVFGFTAIVALAAGAPTTAFVVNPRQQSPTTSAASSVGGASSSKLMNMAKKNHQQEHSTEKTDFGQIALASLMGLALLTSPNPALADGQTEKFKLPPIDFKDPTRCSLNSSTIGQANAARDKLYDLRECSLSGKNAVGFDLSGVIMGKTDLSNANLQEAYFSKGYLRGRFYEYRTVSYHTMNMTTIFHILYHYLFILSFLHFSRFQV